MGSCADDMLMRLWRQRVGWQDDGDKYVAWDTRELPSAEEIRWPTTIDLPFQPNHSSSTLSAKLSTYIKPSYLQSPAIPSTLQ